MRIPLSRAGWRGALPAVLVLLLALACPAFAGGEGKAPAAPKRAILLVAFGTSVNEARPAIDTLQRQAQAAYPDLPVRLAYSSHIIRNELAARGQAPRTPAQALADLAAEGYSQVAVQSLHAIPGREFDDMKATALAFQAMPKGLKKVSIGKPLLYSPEDIARAAEAALASLPERRKGEALLFMGHGTAHPANAAYAALQLELRRRDPLAFVATVESRPSLDDVLPDMKQRGVRAVCLAPFMSVAGDHARNDMAGPAADSWASRLKAAGFAVRPVLVGLGQRPAVAALWLEHLKSAVAELGE